MSKIYIVMAQMEPGNQLFFLIQVCYTSQAGIYQMQRARVYFYILLFFYL